MKFKFYAVAPLWGAMALLVATGCTDELVKEQQQTVLPTGNGIVFEATAAYASDDAQTRTSYGDYDNPTNPTSQAINWEEDDKVDIYSPTSPTGEASGKGRKAEYDITLTDGKAYLTCNTQGLQWGDETQNFYGIYPAVESISNAAVKKRVSFEGTVLKGYVPVNQQHTITKTGNTWTATPNMDYLYMAARATGVQKPVEANQGVKLDFQPLTSTLEITFVGPMEHPMASFNVFANDGESIAGNFSCDLTDKDFTCTPTSQGTTSTYVTVSTYWDDNGTQKPLQLGDGESITFNVFLLPHDNLDNLSVRVAGFNAASKTAQLTENGKSLIVYPHQKSIVKLPAPESFGDINNWISGLPDNVLVSQLSIPGTANSFSHNYNGANPTWYQTQTATFEEQWNAGIRCFELKCPETTGDLGNVTLECNRTDIGITFKQAVDKIWNKVKGTNEFAMIIPAFESGTGHPTTGDDAYKGVRNFANALNTFFNNNTEYEYITYGRNITLGKARGKLMFVARITSEEDEGAISDITPAQGVFIEGWGSLKDLWARRGYNVPNWAQNGDFSNKYMEYYMINGNTSSNLNNFSYTGPTEPTGAKNFMHTTVREDGSKGSAYIQDWNRVSPVSKNYNLYNNSSYGRNYVQNCYWPESFKEKCGDVWNTFLAAIEDNNNQQGSTFYINSLDGFYIDEEIPLSYKPYIAGRTDEGGTWPFDWSYGYGDGGTAGNIQAYAADINSYFYNEILSYGADNIYGPMNVVLLDMVYASDDMTDPGSYLPSVIINNNYRFPLLTNEEAANQSESQFNNGGNAIK